MKNSKVLANQKIIRRYQWRWYYCVTILIFIAAWGVIKVIETPVISPCPDSGCAFISYETPKTIDSMVDLYSMRYGKTKWEQLRTKTMIHYLLLREAAYGNTKTCGDNGLACGPLQYHDATYLSFRKIMIERELVNDIGSRWDMEDSIETTAWAINDGRENNWGPILRGEIKL